MANFFKNYKKIVSENPNASAATVLELLAKSGNEIRKAGESLEQSKARLSQKLTAARKQIRERWEWEVKDKEEAMKKASPEEAAVLAIEVSKIQKKILDEGWDVIVPQLKRGRQGGTGGGLKDELENFLADIG